MFRVLHAMCLHATGEGGLPVIMSAPISPTAAGICCACPAVWHLAGSRPSGMHLIGDQQGQLLTPVPTTQIPDANL
jgi:hypothetical protein